MKNLKDLYKKSESLRELAYVYEITFKNNKGEDLMIYNSVINYVNDLLMIVYNKETNKSYTISSEELISFNI